mgnify:CR=1 FL=1
MAYSTIPKSTSYFNTKLYSGTGAIQTVSGVGFEPSWIWTKSRTNAGNHQVTDQVRGLTKYIRPNATNAEDTKTNAITAVNSDGFVLGADSSNDINASGQTYASWNWKANGSGSANSDGSINSTVSVNTTSGFSIVKYTGTGSAATVGHGLGAVPKMIIVKNLSASGDWMVYHQSIGNDHRLIFNTTSAKQDNPVWNDTTPTSSVWSMNDNGDANGSGSDYIAYCFAEKTGYSKFGSYTGNSSTNGTFVYTGFKPAFVIVKDTSTTANWGMIDNKREGYNSNNQQYEPNDGDAQDNNQPFDILSNGFKLRTADGDFNVSGNTYIYMAFGQPIVSTNGDIATAR